MEPNNHPKAKRIVKAAPAAPAAPEIQTTSPEEAAHQKRMATDREYAEEFLKNSMPEGRTFCVTLEVVNPRLTRELFEATKDQNKLIAGCKVHTVWAGDVAGEYTALRVAVKKLMS